VVNQPFFPGNPVNFPPTNFGVPNINPTVVNNPPIPNPNIPKPGFNMNEIEDQQKLITQLMQLTPEQIDKFPPVERQQIITLRNSILSMGNPGFRR